MLKRFILDHKQTLSWAFYDWANSAFAVAVMAGFFPLFFKQYWSAGVSATETTFHLGIGNSIASLLVVLMAPILGAIADRGSRRKRFLLLFLCLGVMATSGLVLVQQGHWLWALVLYIVATFGFSGGNVFYDSLLPSIAREDRVDVISALGFSLGYLGGGFIFSICVVLTLWPDFFGFSDAGQAVQWSFLLIAVWWVIFAVPLFLYVPEPYAANGVPDTHFVRSGLRQFLQTFRELRRLRVVFLFLLAYWFYIDGVDTVIRMAVDYGLSLGLKSIHLIQALLITQFVGFPAALAFGFLGRRIGARPAILIAIGVYFVVVLWAYQMTEVWEFYVLAVVVGLVQGGVQSLSRSLYSRLIPKNKTAEFFGFYNMLGKFAAVLGPLMMGWVALISGSPRVSILSILVLLGVGGVLLLFVDIERGRQMAVRLE